MRKILVSVECEEYVNQSSQRVQSKFDFLLEVISEQEIIPKNFVEKLTGTDFYELKIKVENQIRIIIFAVDHRNFNQCSKAILLNAFLKRSNKDYKKAIDKAQKLLEEYKTLLDEKD